MASFNLLLLPGDGIGPEVMGEVKKVVNFLGKQGVASFETETDLVGGSPTTPTRSRSPTRP